jgi:asparagine synthase (glutamine-hydrolysing)
MCGICGEWHYQPQSGLSGHVVKAMTKMMARRGPDDEGFWSDGQQCALGFRRLSILDLSRFGHQPMLTRDGRYAIVFNGEVYNFPELRRQLSDKGVHFRSSGDTEVVLYALVHWGKEALARFNGMFSLGFYDTVKKNLLLARDHAGIKPLYYLLTPDLLVFASQYDQILAHPKRRELSISSKALALYLRLGYIPAPFAILENTYMLEPGTWIEINANGQVRQGRFFEFPPYQEPVLRGQEAYVAIDEAVTKAVRRHLISDVPVGTFLSGGIDSPLITAKAQAITNGKVMAFTLGTNGDRLDESPDAIAYAREIGVEQIVEHVRPEQALEMIDEVISACGEPFGDYSIFPTMVISKLARRHVKVMLSGDGGDELFWGYAGRFGSVLKIAQDFRVPYWLRKSRWVTNKLFNRSNSNANLWRSIGDWYKIKHSHIWDDWLKSIFSDLPKWPENCAIFNYNGWELNQTAQWLRWNEFICHLNMVLLKVDRASMFHSLEVRVPLLDREVVELATQIDWRSCLDVEQNLGKLPLRFALARHVNHRTSDKRGFSVPMDAWLRGPLRQVFEDEILDRKDIVGLPVNRNSLRRMFQQHLSGKVDYAWGLWILLSLSLWEKRHFNGPLRAK